LFLRVNKSDLIIGSEFFTRAESFKIRRSPEKIWSAFKGHFNEELGFLKPHALPFRFGSKENVFLLPKLSKNMLFMLNILKFVEKINS
jgi:hypothetical protein